MIYVIADDLTGAAEIAGICWRYRLRTHLSVGTVVSVDDSDALVIATDTRQMNADDAVAATKHIASLLPHGCILFKKTDSALRGHVKVELKALLSATDYNNALYIPANPSRGRILRNGIYYIDGIPIDETSFVKDPDFPAFSAKISERMPEIMPWSYKETNLHYADATSVEDIDKMIVTADNKTLLAGGGDLFEAFLRSFGYKDSLTDKPHAVTTENAVLVCGSTQSKGLPGMRQIVMPESVYRGDSDATVWAEQATKVIKKYGNVMLCIEGSGQDSLYLRTITAETVALLLQNHEVEHLLIEGGATAFSILSRLRWSDLRLVGESAPGVVVLCHEDKNQSKGICTITMKPGSYEWPQ